MRIPRAVTTYLAQYVNQDVSDDTMNISYGGEVRIVLEHEFNLQDFSGIPRWISLSQVL